MGLTNYQTKYIAYELTRRFPPDGVENMLAHRMGSLWKFKKDEIDECFKAGGAADCNKKDSKE